MTKKNMNCFICGELSTNSCASCGVAYYCCKKHQSMDWPNHKEMCKIQKQENNKKLIVIENVISDVFFKNGMQSGCLAASYFMVKLAKKHINIKLRLVRGYVKSEDKYWGHFWTKSSKNKIFDPGSKVWEKQFNEYEEKPERTLIISKPKNLKCVDNPGFDTIQDEAYLAANSGNFWDDVSKKGGMQLVFMLKTTLNQIDQILESKYSF